MEPAPVAAEEVPAFLSALRQAFHAEAHPEDVASTATVLEPERTLAIRDRGRIVGTAAVYSRRLAVPGGAVPLAAVTQVGVLASHRRRGLLTAMMRRQLADVRAAGEPVAALWATESAIYGRFGYGLATLSATLEVVTREARLRHPTDLRADLADPREAIPTMAQIYDAARRTTPGMLDRPGPWWRWRTADPEHRRNGAGPLKAAVIEGAAYALYAVQVRYGGGRPDSHTMVREVVAATPEGAAGIWSHLLRLDLTRRLTYGRAASDDPLLHMLVEAQAVETTVGEALWLRIVDVPAALTRRAYAIPFETVLELDDEFCPWNAGTWRLASDGATATCERTTADPDLALTAADLGAVYLGGTTLGQLARAGRVRELRRGAVATAGLAFRGERDPWCPEIF
jgi:predicted acetyltransferase